MRCGETLKKEWMWLQTSIANTGAVNKGKLQKENKRLIAAAAITVLA